MIRDGTKFVPAPGAPTAPPTAARSRARTRPRGSPSTSSPGPRPSFRTRTTSRAFRKRATTRRATIICTSSRSRSNTSSKTARPASAGSLRRLRPARFRRPKSSVVAASRSKEARQRGRSRQRRPSSPLRLDRRQRRPLRLLRLLPSSRPLPLRLLSRLLPSSRHPQLRPPHPPLAGQSGVSSSSRFRVQPRRSRRTRRNRKPDSFSPRCNSPRKRSTSTARATCRGVESATPRRAKSLGRSGNFVESSPAIGQRPTLWLGGEPIDFRVTVRSLRGPPSDKGEFDRSVRGMLPRPGDPQDVIDTKTKLRHAFLDAVAVRPTRNDPKVLALLAQGKSLNPDGSAAPPQNDGDNAPAGASQGVKDAWSHLSTEAKDRARKRYGQ